MPWASRIIRPFQMVPVNPSVANFLGPYNKLLCTLFPVDTKFIVWPRLVPNTREEPAPRFLHEVRFEDKPVFVLELRHPGAFQFLSKCHDADQDIRDEIEDLKG